MRRVADQRGRAGFVFGEVRELPLAPFPTCTLESRQLVDGSDPT